MGLNGIMAAQWFDPHAFLLAYQNGSIFMQDIRVSPKSICTVQTWDSPILDLLMVRENEFIVALDGGSIQYVNINKVD